MLLTRSRPGAGKYRARGRLTLSKLNDSGAKPKACALRSGSRLISKLAERDLKANTAQDAQRMHACSPVFHVAVSETLRGHGL